MFLNICSNPHQSPGGANELIILQDESNGLLWITKTEKIKIFSKDRGKKNIQARLLQY